MTPTAQIQSEQWRDLYVAGLLEGDVQQLPRLIDQAERAIVARARVLFDTAGDHIQEEVSMDDAMYALHALKSCIALHRKFADVA
jgi:hypothetical protein